MGCGSSTAGVVNQFPEPYVVEVEDIWLEVKKTCDTSATRKSWQKKLVIKRRGWKTVRIFVSSTFKDFHQEREYLVKKVFPDLRAWCESRRLYLVECDLRWGVPKDSDTELTMRACLGEIDRCFQDNIMPFFLNMTSERIGWIPVGDDIPEAVREEYTWVEGLSITEMEIMHGAYRKDNPNALFMLRDPAFLSKVPAEHKKHFIDSEPLQLCKMDILKKMVKDRFPDERVKRYKVEYLGHNPETDQVELGGLDDIFCKTVHHFFRERIAMQYPLVDDNLDPYQQVQEQHESFMKSRCENVIGRREFTQKIDGYICGDGCDVPLLLLGGAGSGKSSIIAKIADIATTKAIENKIPGAKTNWHVFYHFVGAVPDSTELFSMLKRLLREMDVIKDNTMPKDLDAATQTAASALSNPNTRPTIIIVDALNQFDEDKAAELVNWVPRKLSPYVRCVFSMIPDTPQHKSLINREPQPLLLELLPLTEETRKAIVDELFGRYNKRLDEEQVKCLLGKESSENPLWLSIACEELRVFGNFRLILDKINHLSDGLLELEMQVMERFEKENGGELLVATLCLLEVSARGLLETELLFILGDEDQIMPPKSGEHEKDDGKREKKKKDIGQLPAYKWSEVYRALRPFLRPFGDSGEGRLDFYHRSLSKAVRRKYFKQEDGTENEKTYHWFHSKLADYFEDHCTYLPRKLEEYPTHLLAIKDTERLEKLLSQWEVIDELYNEEYSYKLLTYWRLGSDFERLETVYMEKINNEANKPKVDNDDLANKYLRMARILSQAGRYSIAPGLCEKALELEKEKLGSRLEKLADLYSTEAHIMDEELKLEEYMYRSQLPRMKKIILSYQSAAEIYEKFKETNPDYKFKLGKVYNRLSFYYSGYGLRGGDDFISATEASEKSIAVVDQALKLFEELGNEHHIADSYVTKGVSYGRSCSGQIKAYRDAEATAIRVSGQYNTIMDRLYLNMGIYFEELGDYYEAYNHFWKWYDVCVEMYGVLHPRVHRSITTLREPMYRRIAAEKKKPVPELPAPTL